MTPRLLFVDHVGVLGGGELSLLDIARHFRAGSRVILFEDGPFRVRLEEAGVAVEVWPAGGAVAAVRREGRGLRALLALPGVIRLAARLARRVRSFDSLYANSQKSMVIAALAGALARRPVVWHLRDLLTADHFGLSQRRLATAVANRFVTRVIANSHATAEAFLAAGGRADLVTVVYNGIDPAPFEAVTEADVDRLRAELGLNGAPLVGVFSRLAPWKGQHVLLDAMVDLPGVHALFVGDELFGADEGYGAHLRTRAATLGVAERVHFLGFRRDVPALMRLVDVVAHTSTSPEPFGRVIVEAMLAGTPIVATDAGGASELIDAGRTGVLVPPGDASALCEALGRLHTVPDSATALSKAGAEDAKRRFSRSRMLKGVAEVTQQAACKTSCSSIYKS